MRRGSGGAAPDFHLDLKNSERYQAASIADWPSRISRELPRLEMSRNGARGNTLRGLEEKVTHYNHKAAQDPASARGSGREKMWLTVFISEQILF